MSLCGDGTSIRSQSSSSSSQSDFLASGDDVSSLSLSLGMTPVYQKSSPPSIITILKATTKDEGCKYDGGDDDQKAEAVGFVSLMSFSAECAPRHLTVSSQSSQNHQVI